MRLEVLNPEDWAAPKGYSNVVRVSGDFAQVFIAGQIAWDADQKIVGPGDFVAQFRQALGNVAACVRTAGGQPGDLASMTVFVTDKRQYLAHLRELGAIWKEIIGRHWPAMALVQVADLLDEGALVEIQATACVAT